MTNNTTHAASFKVMLLSVFLLSGTAAFACGSYTSTPAKGSKVYIAGTNSKAVHIAKNELAQKGYWTVTDNKNEADVIMTMEVKRIWLNDRKTKAVFTNAKTNEKIYEARPVHTLTRLTFRPGHGVVKKLIRKRVSPLYEA